MSSDRIAALRRIFVTLAALTCLSACSTGENVAGKWQVINYWATWCIPCIEEMPELNRFAAAYDDSVLVYGVNFDGLQGDELAAASDKLAIEFEVLPDDPASRLGYERPQVLPSTYIIDPDGKLRRTLVGPQTVASLAAAIEAPAP